MTNTVVIRNIGKEAYLTAWQAMKTFTQIRDENTLDEIWLMQHPPVFTQGQNGKAEHILNPGNIPVVQVDRGGQVTYHGPGQLVAYTLIDLKRKKLNVREIVTLLENSIIALLNDFNLEATSQCKAPGVYINNKKICSIGLRIRRGCSFHGLALNVAMELEPFSRINPCGYSGLEMTQLIDYEPTINLTTVELKLVEYLISNLGYNHSFMLTERWHAAKQFTE